MAAVLGRRCRSLAALVWRRIGSCHRNRHAATAAFDATQKSGGGGAQWWALQRCYGPRGAAAAALRRLALDAAATGAARAGRRLGCAGTCDSGPEGVAAGRGWSRKVREVELMLLHPGRAMDFTVGLLPIQGGIAAAGAVGGRGGGRCSELGVNAAGPPSEPAGAGARSVWGHHFFFLVCRCMVPAFCEDAGGTWEAAASGTLQHGLWGVRAGPVPAIQAGTMALLGELVGEGVERVVRSQPQGRRRSVDLGTVWHQYDGGIAIFDAGSTGWGTGGGWGVSGRIGAAEGGRQAAPKVEKMRG